MHSIIASLPVTLTHVTPSVAEALSELRALCRAPDRRPTMFSASSSVARESRRHPPQRHGRVGAPLARHSHTLSVRLKEVQHLVELHIRHRIAVEDQRTNCAQRMQADRAVEGENARAALRLPRHRQAPRWATSASFTWACRAVE